LSERAIGIFDSGIGGLTVMRALAARLPNERFIYLGDTARLPYGTKSGDTVTRYALQAASTLSKRDVKMLVVACNTASSVALPALEKMFAPTPVIGVIGPGAEAAVTAAPDGPIAIIATEGTVKGGAYVRAIEAHGRRVPVIQQACPLFVSIAEEGLVDGDIAEAIARRYLAPVLAAVPRPKALVLGCTHFPALKDTIAKIAGSGLLLVDSAETTAKAVEATLIAKNLRRKESEKPVHIFLATDAPDRFARVGEIFLGQPIDPGHVELVDLQS
jgi:glutamate racemase